MSTRRLISRAVSCYDWRRDPVTLLIWAICKIDFDRNSFIRVFPILLHARQGQTKSRQLRVSSVKMSRFLSRTVANLQNYLRERGVTFSGSRKDDLFRLCINAELLNIEIDPDGFSENSASIITSKLTTVDGCVLRSPQHLAGTANMLVLPELSIFDIYKYLLSYEEFIHASLIEYHKLEGYCIFKNEYVKQLETVPFNIHGKYTC